MKRIAIFVSGRGTNMDNIIREVKKKRIRAQVACVVSDVADAGALKKALAHGIKTIFVDPKKFRTKLAFEKEIIKYLRLNCVDYIILAGFMRILSPYIVRLYRNRILNIHPALLPSFKGMHGISDAFEAGVKVTGVTVHFVTAELDGGPIIVQKVVEVEKGETLASLERRIHKIEYELYPRAINLLIQNRLKIKGKRVIINSSS